MSVNIRPRVYKRKRLGDVERWIVSEHRNGKAKHIAICETKSQAEKVKADYLLLNPMIEETSTEDRGALIKKCAAILSSSWHQEITI